MVRQRRNPSALDQNLSVNGSRQFTVGPGCGASLLIRMARADQTVIYFRITVDQPVIGVLHSLQAGDETPLDPKRSRDGAPLVFDFPVRVAAGLKFSGDQVRRGRAGAAFRLHSGGSTCRRRVLALVSPHEDRHAPHRKYTAGPSCKSRRHRDICRWYRRRRHGRVRNGTGDRMALTQGLKPPIIWRHILWYPARFAVDPNECLGRKACRVGAPSTECNSHQPKGKKHHRPRRWLRNCRSSKI